LTSFYLRQLFLITKVTYIQKNAVCNYRAEFGDLDQYFSLTEIHLKENGWLRTTDFDFSAAVLTNHVTITAPHTTGTELTAG